MVIEKQAYRIAELVKCFGIGKTKIYSLIAKGQLQALKSGRITMVSAASVEEWLRTCKVQTLQKLPIPGRKRA